MLLYRYSITKNGRGASGIEGDEGQQGKSPLTYKGAFVGVGGKFEGGGGNPRMLTQSKEVIPE
jgi:hypothetical protein